MKMVPEILPPFQSKDSSPPSLSSHDFLSTLRLELPFEAFFGLGMRPKAAA